MDCLEERFEEMDLIRKIIPLYLHRLYRFYGSSILSVSLYEFPGWSHAARDPWFDLSGDTTNNRSVLQGGHVIPRIICIFTPYVSVRSILACSGLDRRLSCQFNKSLLPFSSRHRERVRIPVRQRVRIPLPLSLAVLGSVPEEIPEIF